MSSSSISLHPPYALPRSSFAPGDAPVAPAVFAAPVARLLPYVPRDARLSAATGVIDAPADAPLVSGTRLATPRPAGTVSDAQDVLPSIDQFLEESPPDSGAVTMAELFSTPIVERDTDVDEGTALPVDGHVEPRLEADLDLAADALPRHPLDVDTVAAGEPWAIADASDAVAELADGLAGRVGATEAGAIDPESASIEPWSDDERWMDIMPALQTPGGPDLAGETAWARAFGEPPAPLPPVALPAGDTEAAAASLEAIARRLRAGELEIPGFRGDRGDAAALAAALAALLGGQD